MAENKFERVGEKDPNRCQGVDAHGQCQYKAVEGSKFCPRHCGAGPAAAAKHELRNYRLRRYHEQVGEKANSTGIKDLREEIGITRMLLQEILELCDNPNKLLMYSGQMSNLINQIQKLVTACQQLEEKNNNLLDRKVVIVIADSIVTLIGQYISDPDQLNEIGSRICDSIGAAVSAETPVGAVA